MGSVDEDDYYRFTLDSNRNFNLSLSGLSNTTQVDLIQDSNGNGEVDYNETLNYDYGHSNDYAYSKDDASIGRFLIAGTYFVRVSKYPYGDSNSNYTLSLFA